MRRIGSLRRRPNSRNIFLKAVDILEYHSDCRVSALKARSHLRDACLLRKTDAGCGQLGI